MKLKTLQLGLSSELQESIKLLHFSTVSTGYLFTTHHKPLFSSLRVTAESRLKYLLAVTRMYTSRDLRSYHHTRIFGRQKAKNTYKNISLVCLFSQELICCTLSFCSWINFAFIRLQILCMNFNSLYKNLVSCFIIVKRLEIYIKPSFEVVVLFYCSSSSVVLW